MVKNKRNQQTEAKIWKILYVFQMTKTINSRDYIKIVNSNYHRIFNISVLQKSYNLETKVIQYWKLKQLDQ